MTTTIPPSPVNILMVDDQPSKLLSYEVMLGELGENLVKASSGREALELLLKMDFAVVLMDVSMPELDGFELAEMIRQHPRFQKTAIIFISAVHLTDVDRLKGYERGAVDYISVPIIPELLRARVSVFAELHRKARQLEALNQELRRLSHSLMMAQDEERRRIARELHDSTGQKLVAAKLHLEAIAKDGKGKAAPAKDSLNQTIKLVDEVTRDIRTVAQLLHPPLLDEAGLISATRWLVDGFSDRSKIQVDLVLPPDIGRLPENVEIALFRVIQESLNNVHRHSGAKKATIELRRNAQHVTLEISDNGKGLPVGLLSETGQTRAFGVGILGMKERLAQLGGRLEVNSSKKGTTIKAVVPAE
jgi:signal transduction histidine kinase